MRERASFCVEGPPGVGKTTLVVTAALGVAAVYIPGFRCRTYECLKKRVDPHSLNIIDDYGMLLRSDDAVSLVRSLPWKIVVLHPGLYAPEVDHLPRIWMPPYTYHEIRQILLERVERLSLPVSESTVDRCAREAAQYSGSVKMALLLLLDYLA